MRLSIFFKVWVHCHFLFTFDVGNRYSIALLKIITKTSINQRKTINRDDEISFQMKIIIVNDDLNFL